MQHHAYPFADFTKVAYTQIAQRHVLRKRCSACLSGGFGDEDLSAGSDCPEAGGAIDGRAEVVAILLERLAEVDCHSHRQHRIIQPWLFNESALGSDRSRERRARIGEDRKCRIALTAGLNHDPTRAGHGGRQDFMVAGKRRRHHLRRSFPQPRRTGNLSEQERHRSPRQVTCSSAAGRVRIADIECWVVEQDLLLERL